MEGHGLLTLVPTAIVVILALWSHRTIESLLAGTLVGIFMLAADNPLGMLADISLSVMMNETVAWIILVCGFMGSLIALFIRTGAVMGFTRLVTEYVSSRRQALMTTWLLGIFLFVDDYLNSLAVGAAMRKVSDANQSSREMLAYVVDSTAAPASVLVPISTWAVFFGALLVDSGLAAEGEGLQTYISAIPWMFYPWLAILLVPLVIGGQVPLIGPLRAAEVRARAGQCVPPEAADIELANEALVPASDNPGSAWQFIALIVILAVSTWYFDLDFLKGIYLTLALYLALIVVQRQLPVHTAFDTVLDGFKTMLQPLAVLVAAYMLKEVNDQLGLSTYVLELLTPYLTAQTLPLAIFVTMALVAFTTGSSWGVFVIAMPMITALTQDLDASLPLVIGATLSASTFGSHACFYSDATVLTAQATSCTPFQHAVTQFPYAMIAAVLSAAGYWLLA